MFFIKCFLKQLRRVFVPQQMGKGPQAAIAGHLVVLNALGRSNECRVDHGGVAGLVDHFLAFGHKTFHCLALLAFGADVECGEDRGESFDLRVGHGEVIGKRGLQLRCRGLLGHLRQGLEQLVLGVVQVLQFLDIQVVQ